MLIEANSQFNVRHNLAYYHQQILFDREGQFVDSPITGEQLRKYYEDYRTNPAYLEANPNDETSWEKTARTNANTECREGQIVVYRFHANDYVCVTTETAEMWIRHGMGEITGDSNQISSRYQQTVSPITNCDEGFKVIYSIESKKYSCILEDIAQRWVEQGIAEFHDPEEYIIQSIERKETLIEIEEINQQIREMEYQLQDKKLAIKKKYDLKYDELKLQSKETEKDAINDFNDGNISNEELSNKILNIRENLESDLSLSIFSKVKETKKLGEHEQRMKDFAQEYDLDPYITVGLSSSKTGYEAVLRE